MWRQTLSIVFAVAPILAVAPVLGSAAVANAAAPPVVYHSPSMDGVNPGTPHTLTLPNETLELYYSPGSTATATGEVCLDGDGDEICGITVEIQATGDVTLDAFSEDVTNDLVFNFSPPTSLRINRLNGTAGDGAPIRLGSLDVIVGTIGGEISVATTSEATGASLQTLAVNDNGAIAVPEPGVALSVLVGAFALAVFGRRMSGSTRPCSSARS